MGLFSRIGKGFKRFGKKVGKGLKHVGVSIGKGLVKAAPAISTGLSIISGVATVAGTIASFIPGGQVVGGALLGVSGLAGGLSKVVAEGGKFGGRLLEGQSLKQAAKQIDAFGLVTAVGGGIIGGGLSAGGQAIGQTLQRAGTIANIGKFAVDHRLQLGELGRRGFAKLHG